MIFLVALFILAGMDEVFAQTPPSPTEISRYENLHLAAHTNDLDAIGKLIRSGADIEMQDGSKRTPLHVAAYASNEDAVRLLAEAGADLNALEGQAYDVVTIAAVANDLPILELALELGANPGQVTSPYEGTALIAAAHLGHKDVVKRLIDAGAPLDHINNLHWTALIEAIVLGDGGPDHVACVRYLIEAGASTEITDRSGKTPLELATARDYSEIIDLIRKR